MTAWYLAPSLVRLRQEVDDRWPYRDRRSDGAVGDAAHAARPSEHNPDAKGCVHALDIDVDGVDPAVIVGAVVDHPAAWYVIFNRRIWSRTHGWAPRPYAGSDPHTGHIHVSITLSAAAEDSTAPWGIKEDDMTPDEIHDAAYAGVRDYFERPDTASLRKLDGVASAPLRLLEHAATASSAAQTAVGRLATAVAGLDGADVDATELAAAIVQALPEDIAKQVLDGLAERLARSAGLA